MQRLTLDQIISKIEAEETFHAIASDYSFTLKIDEYVPYVCGAVHDGHQFRKELWDIVCILDMSGGMKKIPKLRIW